jgi:NAD(P)-dependent dehydrogenase (short-subunit alcohol dehydrogenase family)
MVTAAAHRCGKQLVHDLAADGFDVAVCSLALLASRVKTVESLGRRACALRLLTTHVQSAVQVLDEVHRVLGRVHTLIHIDGDGIIGADRSLDATTTAAMPDLVAAGGTVMFLFDRADVTLPRVASGVNVVALSVRGKSPLQVCGAAIRLLRDNAAGGYVLSSDGSLARC